MGIFLNHVDDFINHLVIDNNFQLYPRHEFHHFIHNFICCVPGPAFAESFDF